MFDAERGDGLSTVVALAGRRVDRGDEAIARFPLENVGYVRGQIARLFQELEVQVLVCSAACGADLIALEEANAAGIRSRVVLPFSRDHFCKVSVVDRPGNWVEEFDRMLDKASERGDLVTLDQKGPDDEAFLVASARILDEAVLLAKQLAAKVAVIVVWDGTHGNGDTTADLAAKARHQGFDVYELTTLRVEKA
jgi:hypothetical protein